MFFKKFVKLISRKKIRKKFVQLISGKFFFIKNCKIDFTEYFLNYPNFLIWFFKGSKRSRRARTSSQDDRRSSIDVSLSRIRRRPEEFFGGLNAEVTAIEMEDLSSGGRCHFHRVCIFKYILWNGSFCFYEVGILKYSYSKFIFRIRALKIQLQVLLVTLHLSSEAVWLTWLKLELQPRRPPYQPRPLEIEWPNPQVIKMSKLIFINQNTCPRIIIIPMKPTLDLF